MNPQVERKDLDQRCRLLRPGAFRATDDRLVLLADFQGCCSRRRRKVNTGLKNGSGAVILVLGLALMGWGCDNATYTIDLALESGGAVLTWGEPVRTVAKGIHVPRGLADASSVRPVLPGAQE